MSYTNRDKKDLETGIRCFLESLYFEAHEAWENVWLRIDPPNRLFLQAMILLAAGAHHYQNNNFNGCFRLLRKALIKSEDLSRLLKPNISPQVYMLQDFLKLLTQIEQSSINPLPHIQEFASRHFSLHWFEI